MGTSLFALAKSIYYYYLTFRAWPDKAVIDPAWERLQRPFLQLLCGESFVYTSANGGQWLRVEEAIFDTLDKNDSELQQLLVTVLLHANQNVACLPDYVLETVTVKREITPSLVGKVLKDFPACYRSLDRIQKLLLLKFVLNGQFQELLGLELLPNAKGGFASFSKKGEAIFICSRKPPKEINLLPGLEHRFLDHDIDEHLFKSLEAVEKQGMYARGNH